jgi:hypothetical protein
MFTIDNKDNYDIFSLDNYVFWKFLTLFKTEKGLSLLAFEHSTNIKSFKAISTIGNESFNFDTVNILRKLCIDNFSSSEK